MGLFVVGEVVGDLWWGCCMYWWEGGIGNCIGGDMAQYIGVATSSIVRVMIVV